MKTSAYPLVRLLMLAVLCTPAWAARPDSDESLTIDAGQMKIDGRRGTRQLSGGVEITRGSLLLKAAEVDMREGGQGQLATALGNARQPATFRQRRLEANEVVEGQGQRIEYDAATEIVRLIGNAQVKVLRNGVLADQVNAQVIVYDHQRDTVDVVGAPASTAGNAPGRVRAVVTPRSAPGGTPRAPVDGASQ